MQSSTRLRPRVFIDLFLNTTSLNNSWLRFLTIYDACRNFKGYDWVTTSFPLSLAKYQVRSTILLFAALVDLRGLKSSFLPPGLTELQELDLEGNLIPSVDEVSRTTDRNDKPKFFERFSNHLLTFLLLDHRHLAWAQDIVLKQKQNTTLT